MPKTIAKETRNLILHSLAEGMSIRSCERIYDVKLNTIMRYGRLMGQGCAGLLDHMMQKVECKELQVDEFWSFVFKKQQNIKRKFTGYDHEGDIWTYVAIDPESKLVPSFWIGMREAYDSRVFMDDLAKRCQNRIHLTTDSLGGYKDAVERGFGSNVDYGQAVKHYSLPQEGQTNRSVTGKVVMIRRTPIFGRPFFAKISTSIVERQNLTARMHVRRAARATNAFSKKLDHFKAAIALHYAYYNLVKIHSSLRMTPAMAAGVTDHLWTFEELIEMAGAFLPDSALGF